MLGAQKPVCMLIAVIERTGEHETNRFMRSAAVEWRHFTLSI